MKDPFLTIGGNAQERRNSIQRRNRSCRMDTIMYPILVLPLLGFTNGFLVPKDLFRTTVKGVGTSLCLDSSNGNDELDSMRQMLEASWESDTMGQVPSDATIAANEAFSSVLTASDRGVGVFFVDLLLPAYDVTQGSNLYDEVLTVEYAIALADCLTGKSSILVRDDSTVQTVSRILDAREKARMESEATSQSQDVMEMDVEEEIEFDDSDNEDIADEKSDDDENNDDESVLTSDVDLFRQQLMSSWDTTVESSSESNSKEEGSTASMDNADKNPNDEDSKDNQTGGVTKKVESTRTKAEKRYRLTSMFGNARISDGPDMMDNVVAALRANALPTEDEENLIILSAITREEMVGVRSLVSKYDGQKKIILVNCKLDPIPKELFGAETVYSLLPLIARGKGSDSQSSTSSQPVPPKVVVLRRYPGDWQVFIDADGSRFQLAATAPSNFSNKRGPPMSWVGEVVQKYLRTQ